MENEFHIARITLEACSPVMIAGGGDDPLYDVLLARDVNGLPMLPATSLAGVLRHGFGEDEEKACAFFGYQNVEEGQASLLGFTDGLFHWSDDKPRDGIELDRESLKNDSIANLGLKQGPVTRDHVRLDERGVVDRDGKFERSAVPAGSRFTFEITQRGDGSALKAVLSHVRQGLWLGGATRSGYGEMACIRVGYEVVDLVGNPERFRKLAGQNLGTRDIVMHDSEAGAKGADWDFIGRIEGPLLIGASADSNDLDRSYYQEVRIVWPKDGEVETEMVAIIPASSLKGALRHRVLYHLRQLEHAEPDNALNRIFGHATNGERGQAGILRFSDILILNLGKSDCITMTHVGLDRFTGGSRRGVLFTDEMLWRPELAFRITPLRGFPCIACRAAFTAALNDLKSGRLGIGADWGDGVGVFERLQMPDFDGPGVGT